jgi:hypothetical protein
MQHKALSNHETDPVRLNNAESELQPQADTDTPRPLPKDVPQLTPSDEPGTVDKRERAAVASGPGSEYWLP